MSADVDALAHRIAYDACVSDIEMVCVQHLADDGGGHWYDPAALTNPDPSNWAAVTRARLYLELFDKLEHHPTRPGLVRFRPPSATLPSADPAAVRHFLREQIALIDVLSRD